MVINKHKSQGKIVGIIKLLGSILTFFIIWVAIENMFFRITFPAFVVIPLTLADNDVPYKLEGHVFVLPWASVTIKPGVTVEAGENATLYSYGNLHIVGSKDSFIEFRAAKGVKLWRGIRIRNAEGIIRHAAISDAEVGISTVSGKADISYLYFKNVISAIYGRDSTIKVSYCDVDPMQHPPPTQNINIIKLNRTNFIIENSIIRTPLSALKIDSIDIGNSKNGIIRNNIIYGSMFPDTDGVDIGDNSVNIEISNNRIYGFADKAISVGQLSTAIVYNNIIVDNGKGLGVGEGGRIEAYNNTFVRVGTALFSYEDKVISVGNAINIKGSIFYQYSKIQHVEEPSIVNISHSLSDAEIIPGTGNIKADPDFIDRENGNYSIPKDSAFIGFGAP